MAGSARAQQVELAGGAEQRVELLVGGAEPLVNQALAHAHGGNNDLARAGLAHDLLDHGSAIGEQRTPGGGDRVDRGQRVTVDALDQMRKLHHVARRNDIAVHDRQRVVALAHVQPRQRAPGAAHGVEGAALQVIERLGLGQRLAHNLQRLFRRLARHVHQRQAADFQRHAAPDPGVFHIHQFQ